MQLLLIPLSLYFITIRITNAFSIPKIEIQHPTRFVYKDKDGNSLTVSNPEKATIKEITYYHLVEKPYPQEEESGEDDDVAEETKDSVEYPAIDPRTVPIGDHSDHEQTPNKTYPGIRPKREVHLKKSQNGKRFKRTYYQGWVPFVVPEISNVEPVHITLSDESKCDDDFNSNFNEYGDCDENNNSSVVDDAFIEQDKDSDKDGNSVDTNEDTFPYPDLSEEQNNINDENNFIDNENNETHEPCDDDTCNETHEITSYSLFVQLVDLLHKIFVEHNSTIQLNNPDLENLIHNIVTLNDQSTRPEASTSTNSYIPTYLNVLKGIFANKINSIIINNEVPVATKPLDVSASKDKINDIEVHEIIDNTNGNVNIKDHEKTTEIVTESTTLMSASLQTNIENSTDKYLTTPSLATSITTVKIETFDDQILLDIPAVHSIETDSSSKKEEPTKTTSKLEEDSHIDKQIDSTEDHKKIQQLVDLVNNENLWKFLGEFGNKYVESLITHTSGLIKDQVAAQVKDILDLNKTPDKKIVVEKEKDKVNEHKFTTEKDEGKTITTEKNKETVTEKNEGTAIDSSKHHSQHNKHNDTNKQPNIFGHSVDNDKVTNIYVFYGGNDIDEVIKYIHQHVNKTNNNNVNHHDQSQLEHSNDNTFDENKPNLDKFYKEESTTINAETLKSPTSAVESIPVKDVQSAKPDEIPTDKADSNETSTERKQTTSEPTDNKEILFTNTVKNDNDMIESELTTKSVIETSENSNQ